MAEELHEAVDLRVAGDDGGGGGDAAPATKKQRIALLIQRGTDMANAQRQREDQQQKRQPRGQPTAAVALSPALPPTRSTRWAARDDDKLRELVERHGTSNWRRVAAEFEPARDRKRCRERYVNHLAPSLAKSPWTREEDAQLAALHREIGPKWAQIARQLGGRGPDDVKNRFRVVSDAERRETSLDTRQTPVQSWSWTETETLRELVHKHGPRNWLLIASQLPGGRTDQQCMQHWYRVADEAIVKGKGSWTGEEDALLLAKVQELGQNWAKIAQLLPGRVGKQCRERFLNHVDPSINKGVWTLAEEELLQREYEKHPSQWARIAEELPGRSANAIKNHWCSMAKSRLVR